MSKVSGSRYRWKGHMKRIVHISCDWWMSHVRILHVTGHVTTRWVKWLSHVTFERTSARKSNSYLPLKVNWRVKQAGKAGYLQCALQSIAERCSALQYVVVRCSALQCFTVRYSALQCVAVHHSALQCVAMRCSLSQCVAVCYRQNTCGSLTSIACGFSLAMCFRYFA